MGPFLRGVYRQIPISDDFVWNWHEKPPFGKIEKFHICRILRGNKFCLYLFQVSKIAENYIFDNSAKLKLQFWVIAPCQNAIFYPKYLFNGSRFHFWEMTIHLDLNHLYQLNVKIGIFVCVIFLWLKIGQISWNFGQKQPPTLVLLG